ncbi:MAG: OmpA family protein [Bacteroidota bacterium]
MLRFLLISLWAMLLCGGVSSGKYKELVALSAARAAQQRVSIRVLQDSTLSLEFALKRSEGGNAALLATQDKYLDRLQTQEDELDKLQGNLTSTSFQMTNQLAKVREELAQTYAVFDTFRAEQRNIVLDFEMGVSDAANVLRKSLDGKVGDELLDITTGAGIVTMSVQEDLLFKPKTVNRLTDAAPDILRAVLDALQSNPLLKLTVIGHTDNEPNPRRNTNNWEYGALRATFLAEELAETYYLSPNRVVAASHGEYGPATSNSTEEGRAKNRRIDFVLRNNVGNLIRALKQLNRQEK